MFYERYISLCDNKKVAPSKVAIECGFNKGSVSVWKKKYQEGEDVKPSSEILIKLADYFDVSTDFLLGKNNSILEEQKNPATDSDEMLMFALYGGDNADITPSMLEDVRNFAKYIREKNKGENH